MGKLIQPEDIADTILFLASERAGMLITDPMPERKRLLGLLVDFYINECEDTPEDAREAAA